MHPYILYKMEATIENARGDTYCTYERNAETNKHKGMLARKIEADDG